MKLCVGLGNPGPQYSHHRHNIGFMVVDALARQHGFAPWRDKFNGLVAAGDIDGEKVILLKPMTFMNLSGQSVRATADFYKIALADVIVFHDDLDLPLARVRIKTGGGAGGHNGLKSIDAHLGAEYQRVRIGIGRPDNKAGVSGYVVGDFYKEQESERMRVIDGLCDASGFLVKGDLAQVLQINHQPPQ